MNTKIVLSLLTTVLLAGNHLQAADPLEIADRAARYESGLDAQPLRDMEQAVRDSIGNKARRAAVEAALAKMLAPTSTFEARRFACVQLSIIGADASLPAIAELLKQTETAGIACLALGNASSSKADELLRQALATSEGMVQIQIITTLGDRKDAKSVKALAALAGGQNSNTAGAALAALGKIATPEALATLEETLSKSAAPERVSASALALLVGGDNAARRGERTMASSIYSRLFLQQTTPQIKRAAFEGLLRTDSDEGEKRILSILKGTDAALKNSALVHIRSMKGAGVSARFAAEMGSLSMAEQALMIETLAVRNDAGARKAISEQCASGSPEIRRAAVVALARIGDAKSVPVLARAMGGASSASEQATIEMALASLKGGDAVEKEILASLHNATPGIKAGLINALARRGARLAVPTLMQESASNDATVAKAAFKALGKLAGPEDLSSLLNCLSAAKHPTARSEAETAAAKLLSRIPDKTSASATVIQFLEKSPSAEIREALIKLLPACGNEPALKAVNQARTDTDAAIRAAALRALAEWPQAAAIDFLLEAAQTAPQNTERILALRGCVRLLNSGAGLPSREIVARFQKAMALAKTAGERKLMLGGLATVQDPGALTLATPYLEDASVQAEAAFAVVNAAPFSCGEMREPTRAALRKVAALDLDPEVKQSATRLLSVMEGFGDFLLAWQVAGPYLEQGKDGKSLFDIPFPPEKKTAQDIKWQTMPAGQIKTRPYQLDLLKLFEGNDRVAYARTYVYSESEKPIRLETGSDDGIKVWLNGNVVLSANRGGDVIPASEKASAVLQPGWNEILLKITQWSAGWGFCVRLTNPDGSSLQNAHASALKSR